MFASIVLEGQSWMTLAAALMGVAAAVVVWRYTRAPLASGTRLLAAVLKGLALAALCLCLLEPLWTGQRVQPGANLFAIVIDNSQSLTVHDPKASASRGDLLKPAFLNEEAPWQIRLSQDFDVRRFVFDTRLHSTTDFQRLDFSGSGSSLHTALNDLKSRFHERPLAGILLVTDGIVTDGEAGTHSPGAKVDLRGLPPIYPIVVGDAAGHRDLAIVHHTVTTTAFEDAPVTIQADVAQWGLAKSKVTARVLDEEGKVVKEETQKFPDGTAPLAFRFQIKPTKPGLSFYEVDVKSDAIAPDKESTAANNRRLIAVDRGSGPYRVLYLSGRPNWEYKFLRRAIEGDEQVQMTGVIRVARREPKFDWRSRGGESTNPLFRGFDRTTEETERYDRPVLVRLNTRDPNELRDGFPKTAAELYQFHAIVIDDLEAEYFTADQQSMLEKFVSERGGGLLMLGGAESFRQGSYERTPVGRMLPVTLDAVSSVHAPAGWKLSLTRDGWIQPWARLRSTETEEQLRLKELPSFRTLNQIGSLKPGATSIAEVTDATGRRASALSVQRFGRGRCAALTIGDLWRAQLDRNDAQREKDDLGKAWRQTIRWLIADVPDRTELTLVPTEESGQSLMRVEARVRTKEFQSQDNAAVIATLTLPDGTVVTQPTEPSLKEAGLYETTFSSRAAGRYRVNVAVVDEAGQPQGRAESGWASDPAAQEFSRVAPNVELLKSLAKETAGQIVTVNGLDSFVQSLPTRKAPLTEAYSTPLWHQPWMLLTIIACLCGEWGLRRWRGLP